MLESLFFSLNFVHPLMEWALLGLGGWVLYLGINAKKVRTGTSEQRKALVSGKFAQRHFLWGSLFLAAMVVGNLGGMVVTYINNEKLFVDAHLVVGLLMSGMSAVGAALSPLMLRGSQAARQIHVAIGMSMLSLFLWQAFTGMEILNKIVGLD